MMLRRHTTVRCCAPGSETVVGGGTWMQNVAVDAAVEL